MACILMDCLVNVGLIILMTMRRVSCSGLSGFNVCVIDCVTYSMSLCPGVLVASSSPCYYLRITQKPSPS